MVWLLYTFANRMDHLYLDSHKSLGLMFWYIFRYYLNEINRKLNINDALIDGIANNILIYHNQTPY